MHASQFLFTQSIMCILSLAHFNLHHFPAHPMSIPPPSLCSCLKCLPVDGHRSLSQAPSFPTGHQNHVSTCTRMNSEFLSSCVSCYYPPHLLTVHSLSRSLTPGGHPPALRPSPLPVSRALSVRSPSALMSRKGLFPMPMETICCTRSSREQRQCYQLPCSFPTLHSAFSFSWRLLLLSC